MIGQKIVAGAGRLAVDAVIGAHDRGRLAVHHRGAKGGEIGVLLVMAAHRHVDGMTARLRSAMDGEMFRRRDDAPITRIVALKPGDEGNAHARGEIGVLAIGLLAPAPARIAEDVDVGRPEIEALEDAVLVRRAPKDVVFHSRLGADGDRHLVDQRRIESGGEADRFGEYGRITVARHTVQRLAPPIVRRDAQAWNRASLVDELGRLLRQRHAADQVIDALCDRQVGIEIGSGCRRIAGRGHRRQHGRQRNCPHPMP